MRKHEENIILEQSREHERRTNKVVGLISLGLVAIGVVTQLLLRFDYSQNVSNANKFVIFPLSAIIICFYLIARHFDFDAPWIKYMLTGGIVLMTTGQFFVFTVFSAYFVLLPLVISVRYFNKRFIAQIAAVSAALFAAACTLNIEMAERWEIVRFAHESNLFDPWTSVIDALVFVIIPLGMTAIFVAAYSIEMTKNGETLLNTQAQAICRITAVDTELQMAAEIQKSALPAPSFLTPDTRFRVEAREIPAKEVGGDFYDYYMVNDHTLAVLIADVSDKGVPAAMFMMSAKKALRCALECCQSLGEAIRLVNRLICENNDSGMFLTLWLGAVDTETGIGKYVNAGHTEPILRSASGALRRITNEPDLFLGCFPEKTPAVHSFAMAAGDTLLLYTDGVSDSMNALGEGFGSKGVMHALQESGSGAVCAADGVMEHSTAFAAGQEQFDDMTILALECISTKPLCSRHINTAATEAGTAEIIDTLNELLAEVNCPEDTRRNADVVTDELCANIVDYAYDGAQGSIHLLAEAGANFLRLVFTDEGQPFNPLTQDDPLLEGEASIGGLGIFFVKSLTDHIEYRRVSESNEVTVEIIWGM